MGIFDNEKDKHEEAYAQGVQDSREAGTFIHGAKDVADVISAPFKDSVDKSYDKGWEDQSTGKVK